MIIMMMIIIILILVLAMSQTYFEYISSNPITYIILAKKDSMTIANF